MSDEKIDNTEVEEIPEDEAEKEQEEAIKTKTEEITGMDRAKRLETIKDLFKSLKTDSDLNKSVVLEGRPLGDVIDDLKKLFSEGDFSHVAQQSLMLNERLADFIKSKWLEKAQYTLGLIINVMDELESNNKNLTAQNAVLNDDKTQLISELNAMKEEKTKRETFYVQHKDFAWNEMLFLGSKFKEYFARMKLDLDYALLRIENNKKHILRTELDLRPSGELQEINKINIVTPESKSEVEAPAIDLPDFGLSELDASRDEEYERHLREKLSEKKNIKDRKKYLQGVWPTIQADEDAYKRDIWTKLNEELKEEI